MADYKDFFKAHGGETVVIYREKPVSGEKILWGYPDNSYTIEELFQMFKARMNKEFTDEFQEKLKELKL